MDIDKLSEQIKSEAENFKKIASIELYVKETLLFHFIKQKEELKKYLDELFNNPNKMLEFTKKVFSDALFYKYNLGNYYNYILSLPKNETSVSNNKNLNENISQINIRKNKNIDITIKDLVVGTLFLVVIGFGVYEVYKIKKTQYNQIEKHSQKNNTLNTFKVIYDYKKRKNISKQKRERLNKVIKRLLILIVNNSHLLPNEEFYNFLEHINNENQIEEIIINDNFDQIIINYMSNKIFDLSNEIKIETMFIKNWIDSLYFNDLLLLFKNYKLYKNEINDGHINKLSSYRNYICHSLYHQPKQEELDEIIKYFIENIDDEKIH